MDENLENVQITSALGDVMIIGSFFLGSLVIFFKYVIYRNMQKSVVTFSKAATNNRNQQRSASSDNTGLENIPSKGLGHQINICFEGPRSKSTLLIFKALKNSHLVTLSIL